MLNALNNIERLQEIEIDFYAKAIQFVPDSSGKFFGEPIPFILGEHLKDELSLELRNWLKELAMAWAEMGFTYYARLIFRKLNIPENEIFSIREKIAGDLIGREYEDYEMTLEFGSPTTIDIAIRNHIDSDSMKPWFFPFGQIREVMEEVNNLVSIHVKKDLRARGSEFVHIHDFVESHDTIIGIANAGRAMPVLAEILEHPNTGVLDYHRRWKKWRPRWEKLPETVKGEKIALCDNDAVTGKTLRTCVPFLQNYFDVNEIDIVFTSTLNEQCVEVAEKIDGVGDVIDLTKMIPKNPFSRMIDIRDKLKKLVEGGKQA